MRLGLARCRWELGDAWETALEAQNALDQHRTLVSSAGAELEALYRAEPALDPAAEGAERSPQAPSQGARRRPARAPRRGLFARLFGSTSER